MTSETPYSVLMRLGAIEIRSYPDLVLASVEGHPDRGAFRFLFRYIAGSNRAQEEIPMTAPVLSSVGHPPGPAGSPDGDGDAHPFSFVLPDTMKAERAPEPLDPRVRITPVGARTVAAIRFRGRAGARSVRRHADALLRALYRDGVRTEGAPFLMRYNPPFTPGFLRRNEVGIEVRL